MATIKITQIKSAIDRPLRQKRTLQALGLRRINQTVEHTEGDAMRGMIAKVAHLVRVEG